MALFEYRAKDLNGTYTTGRLEALDEEQVWWDLRASGLYPVKVKQVERRIRRRPLRAGRLTLFSRQLSVMLRSGIPLVHAVNLLYKKEKDSGMKTIYLNLYEMMSAGTDFSDALEAQKGAFPTFLVTMFRAGEMNGRLSETAEQMKEYYDKEDRLHKKMGTAMLYPTFLLCTMLGALYLVFTMILPEFFAMFGEMEELPALTKAVMTVSKVLTDQLFVVVAAFAGIVLVLWRILALPGVRRWKDKAVLHLPLCGKMFCTIATARFARTFGFLYAEGVPVISALEISSDVIGNTWIKKKFKRVMEAVCDGIPLSAALETVKELDRELLNSIYIGEETGKLSLLTSELAEMYDREAETAADRLTALVEPVLIVLMSILIGCVVLSVVIPIYGYYQTIG